MRRLLTFLTALILCLAAGAQGAELPFMYGYPENLYGTGKAENYDVALQLKDAHLVGLQVVALRVYMPQGRTEGLSNLRGWLTTELTLNSDKQNVPNIATKNADISEGWVEVRFDNPYTITADGFYAGYSFDTDELNEGNKYPIALTSGANVWIHSSRTYRKWASHPSMGALAMQVVLGGPNVKNDAAGIFFDAPSQPVGREGQVDINVVNYGAAGISSFDYLCEVNGATTEGHADLATAVPAFFGMYTTQTVTLPAVSQTGTFPLTVTITKVNGNDNLHHTPQVTQPCTVYGRLPKHRPLVEEYTGTWCQWCPKGIVGMEKMHELYPDDFICLSYHNQDVMTFTTYYPSNVTSFPNCWIDRTRQTDAFLGDNTAMSEGFGIDKVWLEMCQMEAPADINVTAEWRGDSIVEATAEVIFPVSRDDNPYTVAFALVHDDMHGTGRQWLQQNGFSGGSGWPADLQAFVDAPKYVQDLHFNDVIIARSSVGGIEGSLTAPVVGEVSQTYSYAFDLTKIVNANGQKMVQSRNKLRVVAILIDSETGVVVNANKVEVPKADHIGIDDLSLDGQSSSVATFYDLMGRRVPASSADGNRLLIKREVLGNGKVRTLKTFE